MDCTFPFVFGWANITGNESRRVSFRCSWRAERWWEVDGVYDGWRHAGQERSMTETAAGGSVRAAISGEVSGQIAVGNNIVQNNVAHGGLVYMAAPGERPLVRERRKPVYLRGRRPRELAGRKAEVDAALGAVRSGEPVQFYGPPGAGK